MTNMHRKQTNKQQQTPTLITNNVEEMIKDSKSCSKIGMVVSGPQ